MTRCVFAACLPGALVCALAAAVASGCGGDGASACDNTTCNTACVAAGSASGVCSEGRCECLGRSDGDADGDGDVGPDETDAHADADADADADAGADTPCDYPTFGGAQRVEIRAYADHAMEPFVTRDGRWLLFNNWNDPSVNTNLHVAERVDDLTFEYRGELAGANTDALEGVPSVDDAGTIYFVSLRSYATTFSTLYRGAFADGAVSDVTLVEGVSREEAGWVNFDAEIGADGETLWLVDGLFDSATSFWESADLVVARRNGAVFERDPESAVLLATVNTALLEYAPATSRDGLLLMFTRMDQVASTPPTIHVTVRPRADAPFCEPIRVETPPGLVEAPTLSPAEDAFYFHRLDGDLHVVYRMTRR